MNQRRSAIGAPGEEQWINPAYMNEKGDKRDLACAHDFASPTRSRGSIQNQRPVPIRQAIAPSAMPQFQPSNELTNAVRYGAGAPPRFPPVLKIPAAIAPRRPPSSTAVVPSGASPAPTSGC